MKYFTQLHFKFLFTLVTTVNFFSKLNFKCWMIVDFNQIIRKTELKQDLIFYRSNENE